MTLAERLAKSCRIMTDLISSFIEESRELVIQDEREVNKVGRPSSRDVAKDRIYFLARSKGKSKSTACVAAGYNYSTVMNEYAKTDWWKACEAKAKEIWLDSLEEVVNNDAEVNPQQARKILAKHRKEEFGEDVAEVKVTHVVDVESAVNDILKLAGISQEGSGGKEEPSSDPAIEGVCQVISGD